VLWLILTGLILTTLTLADTATVRALEARAENFQAAAANVRKIQAPEQIEPATCDALTTVSTIHSSGAIAEASPLYIDQAPNMPLTMYDSSVGFGEILGVHDPYSTGVWVEAALAKALMLGPGDSLTTSAGPLSISAVFDWPADGRDARLSYAVIQPTASRVTFDECWTSAWPVTPDNDTIMASTARLPTTTMSAQVGQVNKNLGAELDANRLYRERITRHIGWVAPITMTLLGFVSVWRRRLEYAGALHAGQDRASLLLGLMIEALIWALVGGVVSLVATAAGSRLLGVTDSLAVWLGSTRIVIWSAFAAAFGAAIGGTIIRERQLFHYFRTR
jgi:uncharacterized Tic20 family protein